jgi:hypothetical protein
MSNLFEHADIVYTYTRANAIADGELVDLTEWAGSEKGFLGGFTIPVAVTRALWATIEAIPKSLAGIADVRGRAHDVLWMASLAARAAAKGKDKKSRVGFSVLLPSRGTRKRNRRLLIDIGPGDNAEPVITIGFPEDF